MTCKNGVNAPGDRNIDDYLLAFCGKNVDCGEHDDGGCASFILRSMLKK